MDKPTIGRIVVYHNLDGEDVPAMICKEPDEHGCWLQVFQAPGPTYSAQATYSATPTIQTWRWPERH